MGRDPAATVHAEIDQARAALLAVGDDDRVIVTVVGGMKLSAYLPTRTFELTAHSLDLATATGLPVEPPDAVMESALHTAAAAVARTGDGVTLLRHLLGRPGGSFQPLFG